VIDESKEIVISEELGDVKMDSVGGQGLKVVLGSVVVYFGFSS